MAAGEVVRIRTTGGGGWGDPLEREPDLVARDVWWGKVSPEAAADSYGVVLDTGDGDRCPAVDEAATAALRSKLRAARGEPLFFDRGPGYPRLSGGRDHADVDEV